MISVLLNVAPDGGQESRLQAALALVKAHGERHATLTMSAFHPLWTFDSSFIAGFMKSALLILGIAAMLMGLLWIGQGAGLIHWPASSFMIDERPWVTRGAILAVVGLIFIAASRAR